MKTFNLELNEETSKVLLKAVGNFLEDSDSLEEVKLLRGVEETLKVESLDFVNLYGLLKEPLRNLLNEYAVKYPHSYGKTLKELKNTMYIHQLSYNAFAEMNALAFGNCTSFYDFLED